VLQRMHAIGMINDTQLAAARAEKLVLRTPGQRNLEAPHVAEMARRAVVERFGEGAYSTGVRVYTSLRSSEQRAAQEALRNGILAQDRRNPWRGPEAQETLPGGSGAEQERAAAEALKNHQDHDLLRVGIVVSATPPHAATVQLASGERISLRGDDLHIAVQAGTAVAERLRRGAVVRVVAQDKGWALSQWPEAEGALVALDPKTGRVRALAGGFDFTRQPFNHATQSWRQPGSIIKPLLYSAALEERVMPSTLVDDLPFTAANGWSPGNSGGSSAGGPISLREALARSSNLVSVRVLQHTGTQRARDWLGRFGLDVAKQPDNLTLALGTGLVTPLQMAGAYATLANGGWPVEPVVVEKITDAQGKTLYEAPPAPSFLEERRAISARNAWLMNQMLADVTRVGTAARVQATLKRADLYGKTGTTSDVFDAWFAGYQPTLAAVVWVGHDKPRSLGDHESGGRLALPIWTDFMASALKGVSLAPTTEPPAGLARAREDWVYAEWVNGGAVESITEGSGTVLAGPPTLLDALRDLLK
jgi:penicillin-binding protein 1A